jgi:hypothetical protein
LITLKIQRVDRRNNNTPVLYDREIDEFAHVVLTDYKPELLREPGAIRFEHFLESYCGHTILYKDIYSDDPERPIFGATAFRDGVLKVFDRENTRIKNIKVPGNTVIMDNFVMQPGKEGLALFTGLHEGGHILIHPGVYADGFCDGQISLFDDPMPPIVCCRRESVESFGRKRKNRTPKEWREHHADYFAAAIAMPNATFIPFVNRLLREHGYRKKHIILGRDGDLDILAEELMPNYIAEVYGVSRQAAFVKLKKSGFVVDEQTHRTMEAQLTF